MLNGVMEGKVGVAKASGLMGVSERHGWRLLAAYRKEGPAAVAHGNRGRKPATTTCPRTQQKVMELAEGPYAGLNHTHLTEMLAEREDVHLSRSTVRRVLLAGGLRSPRRRRASRRYSRRERYPQQGMLLQIDGSRHDWLQGRGPYLTLVGAVDDTTGTVPFALFRQQEDAHGYMLMLKDIIDHHGVPLALYSDRHGIFLRSPKETESLEEQLRGRRNPTQFGRALKELDIRLILAHTPQAKGRIERIWDSFQDRLLDAVLCFKYIRTVANDNTVRFNGATLQILADDLRASYARAKVEVQERLDGSIVVVHRGRTLAAEPAATEPVTLRARSGRRANGHWTADVAASGSNGTRSLPVGAQPRDGVKSLQGVGPPRRPAPNHPWRRRLLT